MAEQVYNYGDWRHPDPDVNAFLDGIRGMGLTETDLAVLRRTNPGAFEVVLGERRESVAQRVRDEMGPQIDAIALQRLGLGEQPATQSLERQPELLPPGPEQPPSGQ